MSEQQDPGGNQKGMSSWLVRDSAVVSRMPIPAQVRDTRRVCGSCFKVQGAGKSDCAPGLRLVQQSWGQDVPFLPP